MSQQLGAGKQDPESCPGLSKGARSVGSIWERGRDDGFAFILWYQGCFKLKISFSLKICTDTSVPHHEVKNGRLGD